MAVGTEVEGMARVVTALATAITEVKATMERVKDTIMAKAKAMDMAVGTVKVTTMAKDMAMATDMEEATATMDTTARITAIHRVPRHRLHLHPPPHHLATTPDMTPEDTLGSSTSPASAKSLSISGRDPTIHHPVPASTSKAPALFSPRYLSVETQAKLVAAAIGNTKGQFHALHKWIG